MMMFRAMIFGVTVFACVLIYHTWAAYMAERFPEYALQRAPACVQPSPPTSGFGTQIIPPATAPPASAIK